MKADPSPRLARLLEAAPLLEDAAVRALDPASRQQLGQSWRRRAENEPCTSRVFAQLHAQLRRFDAAEEVLALAEGAIDDEAFHGELCRHVAEIYLQQPVSLAAPSEPAAPVFAVCAPRVHQALFAALHCTVNETLAVTYLAACLAEATAEAAKRALKEVLRDEVRHARIGWAVLASPQLDARDRKLIAEFMPALLDVCVATWLADNEDDSAPDPPQGHGCIRSATLARAVDDALTGVILPGLAHVGVNPEPAQLWVSRARP
jgi:hypothetical protein